MLFSRVKHSSETFLLHRRLVVPHTEEFKELVLAELPWKNSVELHLAFLHVDQLVTNVRLSFNSLWKS